MWNELDRLLYRSQADMRARKRRLVEMLRAYRAAATALPDAVVVVERNSQRVHWFNEPRRRRCSACAIRATSARRSAQRLQPMPLSRWLAAGRNAEPLLDTPSPVDPDHRASACA